MAKCVEFVLAKHKENQYFKCEKLIKKKKRFSYLMKLILLN